MIESLLKNDLEWENDDDFIYQVVTEETSPIDSIFTNPKKLYQRKGRNEEYEEIISKLILERKEFLLSFEKLNERIIQAI